MRRHQIVIQYIRAPTCHPRLTLPFLHKIPPSSTHVYVLLFHSGIELEAVYILLETTFHTSSTPGRSISHVSETWHNFNISFAVGAKRRWHPILEFMSRYGDILFLLCGAIGWAKVLSRSGPEMNNALVGHCIEKRWEFWQCNYNMLRMARCIAQSFYRHQQVRWMRIYIVFLHRVTDACSTAHGN